MSDRIFVKTFHKRHFKRRKWDVTKRFFKTLILELNKYGVPSQSPKVAKKNALRRLILIAKLRNLNLDKLHQKVY